MLIVSVSVAVKVRGVTVWVSRCVAVNSRLSVNDSCNDCVSRKVAVTVLVLKCGDLVDVQ